MAKRKNKNRTDTYFLIKLIKYYLLSHDILYYIAMLKFHLIMHSTKIWKYQSFFSFFSLVLSRTLKIRIKPHHSILMSLSSIAIISNSLFIAQKSHGFSICMPHGVDIVCRWPRSGKNLLPNSKEQLMWLKLMLQNTRSLTSCTGLKDFLILSSSQQVTIHTK